MKEFNFNVIHRDDKHYCFAAVVEINISGHNGKQEVSGRDYTDISNNVKYLLATTFNIPVANIFTTIDHNWKGNNVIGRLKVRIYETADFVELDKRLTNIEDEINKLKGSPFCKGV
jgi:hypothetical protein